jgi:hypothetical protein
MRINICNLIEELKEFQHSPLLRQQKQATRSVHFVALTITKEAKEYADSWKNCGVDDIADSIALDLNKLHLV